MPPRAAHRCETERVSQPHSHSPGPLADASVRPARPSDAPAIGLVQSVVWQQTYAGVLDPDIVALFEPGQLTPIWRQALADSPSPAHTVMVACAGDQVVGFSALGPATDADSGLPAESGEVTELCVHPDARLQGHGSRLLNASADTLRAGRFAALACWVRAHDEGTRAFLATGGLEPDGAWRERVVGPAGQTLGEVRVLAAL